MTEQISNAEVYGPHHKSGGWLQAVEDKRERDKQHCLNDFYGQKARKNKSK
jgi:hypothetical protein